MSDPTRVKSCSRSRSVDRRSLGADPLLSAFFSAYPTVRAKSIIGLGHAAVRLPLRVASVLVMASTFSATCLAASSVSEEHVRLPVAIAGRAEHLEALIVKPETGKKLPIALIVNGSSPQPWNLHASGLAHLAHDFAHRGWLAVSVVWRGYGNSSGAVQDQAGTCAKPDVARFLNAHADDLAAALTALQTRPDVERSTVLGVGVSIGGASMLNLSARPHHPLTAVINISGGLYHKAKRFVQDPACEPFRTELVRQISGYGAASIPALWLYAENDPWFPPEFVARMLRGYRATGGKADFTMFPPFGADGHTLFRWEANDITIPRIDAFLRANRLPAMESNDAFSPLLAVLGPRQRKNVGRYLRAPTEKALAVSAGDHQLYWNFANRSIEGARKQALENCRTSSGQVCALIAENGSLLASWSDAMRSKDDVLR